MKRTLLALYLLVLSGAGQVSRAQENQESLQSKGRLNLSLSYPGAGIRYFTADGRALELLAQAQDSVLAGGLRYYHYPAGLRRQPLSPYFAVEGNYLDFKGSAAKGAGWGGGLYAGAEYRLGRRLSAQTELGAMYVSITDDSTSLGESGLEFLINISVNFYFGGRP